MQPNSEMNQFLRNKRLSTVIGIAVIFVLYFVAAFVTNFKMNVAVMSFPKAANWIAKYMIPDAQAIERLPRIIEKLTETILVSVAATTIAAVFAFIASIFGSASTKLPKFVNTIVRVIAAFFRNVPDVVWAMILMFSFGQNLLTGFFALFFSTFGMLTRRFIETIDETSKESIEALTACGASFPMIVFQGILPSSISGIITWILYMIETNIRSSTLIGMLTATGIGNLFNIYYNRMQFGSASLIIVLICVIVILIDNLSTIIRRAIN
ncbi:MAG: ABC transporter permease subunit [Erysipelotrichaceae bacterium]|nr:ABC transporter permease subunit [Erysipelotrichaceae bacterium]